jgi:hypothetical protein
LRARSRHASWIYTTETITEEAALRVGQKKGRFRAEFEAALATLEREGVTGPVRCLDAIPAAADSDARHWWPQWTKARWEIRPAPAVEPVLTQGEARRREHAAAALKRRQRTRGAGDGEPGHPPARSV